jgi:hypothetical protein
MVREKQLPTPPPEGRGPGLGHGSRVKHVKGSSSASAKRLVSGSSNESNGQIKRTAYGSEADSPNGMIHDDLLIRLLAQRAMVGANENHVLSQDEIEDLGNVSMIASLC